VYSGIDKNLVHIVASGVPPFTDRGVLYLPSDMFSMIAGTIGSGGEAIVGSSATAGPTITETNAADHLGTVKSSLTTVDDQHRMHTDAWDASGTAIVCSAATPAWVEFRPYPIAANAGGDVAAQDIVAAVAAATTDLEIWFIADTTGTYAIDFEQDPTGTPAATTPDWTGPVSLSLVAGYRYGPFRIMNQADNKSFGHDAGAGTYPANAVLTVWGHYRGV